jgi:hypothetical protein
MKYLDEVESIADEGDYLRSMAKSFEDKLWFIGRIPKGTGAFVDFGGSDGSFCELVRDRAADGAKMKFVVVDFNRNFLDEARRKGFYGFESLEEYAAARRKMKFERAMLNLSSVIHEVYSYARSQAGRFWRSVGECQFRAAAIRDMYFDEEAFAAMPEDSAEWVYKNVFMDQDMEVRGKKLAWLVRTFEAVWGPIFSDGYGFNAKNLAHFLFKYRYGANWAREVQENYLPIRPDELEKELTSGAGFGRIEKQFTTLPFTVGAWIKDFKLDMPSPKRHRERFARWLSGVRTHLKWLALR